MVKAKKHLGQHFLKDFNIARKIVGSLTDQNNYQQIVEIGPGTGVLTQYLIQQNWKDITLFEIDEESVEYLKKKIGDTRNLHIYHKDFLKANLDELFPEPFGLIGNFPYNISSQIFFKLLETRQKVPELVGMVQREVAERICANEGSKTYGILSVLIGAYYERKLLFKVPNHVFLPPPKVTSAVIRLKRKSQTNLDCDENLFFRIVKQGFQNRRKTLRNALKPINLPSELTKQEVFGLRAEQLSIPQFINLVKKIESFGRT